MGREEYSLLFYAHLGSELVESKRTVKFDPLSASSIFKILIISLFFEDLDLHKTQGKDVLRMMIWKMKMEVRQFVREIDKYKTSSFLLLR